MSRRLSAVALAVCALVSIKASAQSQQQSATRIQEIVLEISIIEIPGAQPNALEKMGKTTDLLDGLISEGKARLITNLQMRTRTEESFNARVGQRLPGQTRIPPAFQENERIRNDLRAPVRGYPAPLAVWEVAHGNIGFIVEGSSVAIRDGLLDIRLKLEVTALDYSVGSLGTPMPTKRTVMRVVRMKESETSVLMVFQQDGPLSSYLQSGSDGTSAAPGRVFVLLTTKPVQ